MRKINLEIAVFLCGAVVMAYEIIGSRMLGPFVGTSMIVWSSIIGIILFSLSMGYYYGGKLADRKPRFDLLSGIIGSAGLFVLLSLLIKNPFLNFLNGAMNNIHLISIISSLVLFSIPAILLGMVSPFAARLKIKDRRSAGATVGYLYSLSTVGSITGTFLAGFYLIPGYGLTSILLMLAITLILISGMIYFTQPTEAIMQTQKISTDEKI